MTKDEARALGPGAPGAAGPGAKPDDGAAGPGAKPDDGAAGPGAKPDDGATYAEVEAAIEALIAGERDAVAVWATAICELHHAFAHYHWTGVYRVDGAASTGGARPDAPGPSGDMLVIGPYQGRHGCLRIPFDRGVCGAAARTRTTQRVPDVTAFPGHIACSATTRSELVVPVITPAGRLLAVIDVDSDWPDAFDDDDVAGLERIAARLAGHLERLEDASSV